MHDSKQAAPNHHVYVAVRADLPPAYQAVQAVHAGISAGRELIPSEIENPNLVLLTVPDLPSLLALRIRRGDPRLGAAGVLDRSCLLRDLHGNPYGFLDVMVFFSM